MQYLRPRIILVGSALALLIISCGSDGSNAGNPTEDAGPAAVDSSMPAGETDASTEDNDAGDAEDAGVAFCGNNVVDEGEECDDGAAQDGDGCSATCTAECEAPFIKDPAGHCYVLVTQFVTWEQARAACQTLPHGDLAALSTETERAFLATQDATAHALWLGGTDAVTEGTWTWSNGEPWTDPMEGDDPVWGEDEPNNSNGNENCLQMRADRLFNDLPCESLLPTLCELPFQGPALKEDCGDGIPDGLFGGTEECDDHNVVDDDGCSAECISDLCDGALCKRGTAWIPSTPPAPVPTDNTAYDGSLASMTCVSVPIVASPDTPATLSGVWVGLNMSHSWIGDLTIKLISPTGTVITLVSRPGLAEPDDLGGGDDGDGANLALQKKIVFRDGAAVSAEDMGAGLTTDDDVCGDALGCAFAPNAGAAAPGTLSALAGENPVGTWKLCAGDAYVLEDNGSIHAVSLALF